MFGRWRRATIETTTVGGYELRVEVLHAGTRSEGRIGRLFLDGREVRASVTGETVTTGPGGPAFVFLGDDRPHLWSTSGWALHDG